MSSIADSVADVQQEEADKQREHEQLLKSLVVRAVRDGRRIANWHGKLSTDQVLSCSLPQRVSAGKVVGTMPGVSADGVEQFKYTLQVLLEPDGKPATVEVYSTFRENGEHVFEDQQVRGIFCEGVDVTDFADMDKVFPGREATRSVRVASPAHSAGRDRSRAVEPPGFGMSAAS